MPRCPDTANTRSQCAATFSVLLMILAGLACIAAAGHVCAAFLHNWLPHIFSRWTGRERLTGPSTTLSFWGNLEAAFQYFLEALTFARIADIVTRCGERRIFVTDNIRTLTLIGWYGVASCAVPFFNGFVEGWTDTPSNGAATLPTHPFFCPLIPTCFPVWHKRSCPLSWPGSSARASHSGRNLMMSSNAESASQGWGWARTGTKGASVPSPGSG